MSQGQCRACGAATGRDDETCPVCGELTALGERRDAEHRREFQAKGTVSVGMMCGIALMCALLVLLAVALGSAL